MNDDILFLETLLNQQENIEDKIFYLKTKERQYYNYYCDSGNNFTDSQNKEYHTIWNWIIDKLNYYKSITI